MNLADRIQIANDQPPISRDLAMLFGFVPPHDLPAHLQQLDRVPPSAYQVTEARANRLEARREIQRRRREAVLDYLRRRGPKTYIQLAEVFDLNVSTSADDIRALRDAGRVEAQNSRVPLLWRAR